MRPSSRRRRSVQPCRGSPLSLASAAMAKKGKPRKRAKRTAAKKSPARKAPVKKTSPKKHQIKKLPAKKPVPVPPTARAPLLRKTLLRRQATSAPRPRPRDPFDIDLGRTKANFQPLTPLSALERAASVFPGHTAIIHGRQRISYATFYARCRALACALAARGIKKGDTVAAMLANTPAMLEAHHGVPMTGAVLNALNTRLDAAAIAYMLEHGGAKILITDPEFSATVKAALAQLKNPPLVIDYDDPEFPQSGEKLGQDYENFLASGDPDFDW